MTLWLWGSLALIAAGLINFALNLYFEGDGRFGPQILGVLPLPLSASFAVFTGGMGSLTWWARRIFAMVVADLGGRRLRRADAFARRLGAESDVESRLMFVPPTAKDRARAALGGIARRTLDVFRGSESPRAAAPQQRTFEVQVWGTDRPRRRADVVAGRAGAG